MMNLKILGPSDCGGLCVVPLILSSPARHAQITTKLSWGVSHLLKADSSCVVATT